MAIKVSEATRPQLNYLVADIEGKLLDMELCEDGLLWFYSENAKANVVYSPSTDWSQGGPLIEREGVNILQTFSGVEGSFATPAGWEARIYKHGGVINPPAYFGPTPLVAAMRCYVASKIGEMAEIPEGWVCDD